MDLIAKLAEIVGAGNVATGDDTARWREDWTGKYHSTPAVVVRPGSTAEVSAIMALAHATGTPIVPVSGNTGLNGGTFNESGVMISLDRMNKIREIRPDARIAIVEAGVILANLHAAVEEHDLVFPLTFGARGSAMIGGALSTNAGGSNVVRYGSTRGLCLGLEVVLADGQVLDVMSELHKDNSGYDLKDLFIGAEGTLGLITGAVVRLFPKPAAFATAMFSARGLREALTILNRLQVATGGAVEAFEYMPRHYIETHVSKVSGARSPFDELHDVNVMVEVGATAPRDAAVGDDGSTPIVDYLEAELGTAIEEGLVLDAVVARSETQRREMWTRREQAAEITLDGRRTIDSDVALPTDKLPEFLERLEVKVRQMDPDAETMIVAHLGDGNIHHTVYPTAEDSSGDDAVREMIEDLVIEMAGSFSAEHGIGLSKLPSMRRRKNAVAVDVMRKIKAALDPAGLLNPGKVLPND